MGNDFIVTIEEDSVNVQTTLQSPFTVETGLSDPNLLDDHVDIDTTTEGKLDGSILVYKTSTNMWTSTTLLNNQRIDAGEF